MAGTDVWFNIVVVISVIIYPIFIPILAVRTMDDPSITTMKSMASPPAPPPRGVL